MTDKELRRCKDLLYNKYGNMMNRCYNLSNKMYPKHGAVGVTVCDAWRGKCQSFIKWAFENGYKEGATIKRTNTSREFGPDNCRVSEQTLAERFANKYVINPENGCWDWIGTKVGKTRGTILNGKTKKIYASRASWIIHNGEIPDGLNILHKCDRPICCNPDHLFLGTQADNMRDCASKGRTRGTFKKGQRSIRAALTDDQVVQIKQRLNGYTGKLAAIAKEYNVHWNVIYGIKTNKFYKNVSI